MHFRIEGGGEDTGFGRADNGGYLRLGGFADALQAVEMAQKFGAGLFPYPFY